MKKFEYRVKVKPNIDELNRLGLLGWELVLINNNTNAFYLKRQLTKN